LSYGFTIRVVGGESRIRTHDTFNSIHAFQACAENFETYLNLVYNLGEMKRLLAYLFLSLLFLVFCNTAFAGCIEGNCRNGQGTYTWADGSKYVGGWKDDRLHGEGVLTYPYGGKHVGEFKNNRRHGQGTSTYSKGEVYKGIWKKGKLIIRQ